MVTLWLSILINGDKNLGDIMLLACLFEGGLFYSVSKLGELSWLQIEIEIAMTEAAVTKPSMEVTKATAVTDPMIKIVIVVEAAIAKAVGPASAGLPQWMRINNAR
jgi:hypothetical protein